MPTDATDATPASVAADTTAAPPSPPEPSPRLSGAVADRLLRTARWQQ